MTCPYWGLCVWNPLFHAKLFFKKGTVTGGPWTHGWHGPTETIHDVVQTYLRFSLGHVRPVDQVVSCCIILMFYRFVSMFQFFRRLRTPQGLYKTNSERPQFKIMSSVCVCARQWQCQSNRGFFRGKQNRTFLCRGMCASANHECL